jgi:two-component system, sensor histidine kinase RpfC
LDIARIESGTMSVRAAPFDLHVLLATVRALLHHQAREKGLELRLTIDPRLPHRIHGAGRALQQILVNLAVNAIKFTEVGQVTIRVSAEAVEPDKVMLRVDVQDTGIGIPLHAQEHIFERFAQVDESATRRHGGSGLGLAIARQLTNLMGGFLVVNSTPGAGSCFTFRGPFGRASEREARLTGRVVVIGEPAYTAAYVERIRAWGAEVAQPARPGQTQALVARAARPPALLLVDSGRSPLELAALTAWSALPDTEPSSVVLISSQAPSDGANYLAILPPQVEDARLFAALHAAMAEPEVPPSGASSDASAPKRARLKVLVAEDNRINQQVIDRMLRSVGHSVMLVGDGEQALDALEAAAFDVVLMDVNMPVMNGLDAVKLHRFANGGRDSPPFIALTADATEETRRQCEEAGMAGHVTKPVDMDQLLDLLDRVTRPDPAVTSRVQPSRVRPAETRATAAPVLDATYLDRLRELDDQDDFLGGLVREFISDAAQLVDEIEAAALKCDAAAFRERAHALRSSAAHLGATAVFELCLEWRGIGADDLAAAGSAYAMRLRSEFERLHEALLLALAQQRANGATTISRPH